MFSIIIMALYIMNVSESEPKSTLALGLGFGKGNAAVNQDCTTRTGCFLCKYLTHLEEVGNESCMGC